MSLVKKQLKAKQVCKVTFRLPSELASGAARVTLVGDFNDWDPATLPLEKLKSGDFKVTIDLESGRDYQFRYLIDGTTWLNDGAADRYVPSGFAGAENSVVAV